MSSEIFTGGITISTEEQEKLIPITPLQTEEEKPLVVETPTTDTGALFTGGEDIKVSNLEKLEYAYDKNTQLIGNIFRIGKAKVQDIFDKDKTFQDYIKENELQRQEEIKKEHWKFAGGEYDNDNIVKAGEIATTILDPGYILAYATPWGRAALKSYGAAAAFAGTTVSLDVALRDLATKGEVDVGKTALAGTIGAALGPIAPAVGKIFSKYAPSASQKQVGEVVTYIENKIAKDANITVPQLNKMQQIVAADKEVAMATNNIIKWSNQNFISPITKEVQKFKAFEKPLLEKNKVLTELYKASKGTKPIKGQVPGMLPQTKNFRQQVLENKIKIKEANAALETAKAELYKKQIPKIQKYAELVAKRDEIILSKLLATETKVDWAVKMLLANTTKPLMGGAAGLTAGVLFGNEENLFEWFATGAVLGATQKYIQASKKFKLGDKNKILGIIDSEAVKYNLQQIRSFTSSTSSTKLESYGGATEQVGKLLLESIDSSVSQKSVVANADRLAREFTTKAYNIIKPYNAEEQAAAISIVRGKQLTKDTPERVAELSKNIKNYLTEFKKVYNDAGFFSKKEIDDYFPRVFDWEKINKDPTKFQNTLEKIYTSLKVKNPKKAAEAYLSGHKNNTDSVFNREVLQELFTGSRKISGVSKKQYGNKFIYTPISEHIVQERTLRGPYKLVEEVLEKEGYLVNDAAFILSNIVNKSMKSIAFTRQFGENGQLLKPFFEQIKQKYINSGLDSIKANRAAAKEASLVADTVDAYFDRYGQQVDGLWKSSAAILSTLANLNMLGRVTISSLGDLVQPIQNSFDFMSVLRALPVVGQKGFKTAFTVKGEESFAKALNLAETKEITRGLLKPLGVDSNIINNLSWMGKPTTSQVNSLAFKALGLEWLTGFARRFAYNVGAGDAYGLSKTLNKMVANGISLDSRKALKVIENLSKFNIKPQTALDLGKTKSLDVALQNPIFKKSLHQAGITTANRDALLPQFSNRLLFTQSQNPWTRLLGQFMSWAMAKSAQTNKILQRIENGNAKTLVKMLAVLPVYGGIQSLREIAKYGEVVTDFGTNNNRWLAEAFRLSGLQGYIPDLFINKTVGPGSREPWYQFAPAFQIAKAAGELPISIVKGEYDKASRIFWQKLAPLPEWREQIGKIFGQPAESEYVPIKKRKLTPLKFATGDLVSVEQLLINDELNQNENQEINLVEEKKQKQLPTKISVAEEKVILPPEKPIQSQMDKLIEPKEKPVKMQVENLLKDKYKKVGELTGEISSAGKPIYLTSEGEKVSEKSITIKYNNQWLNVPTIYEGYKVNEDTVRELLDKNLINPTSKHKTLEEAKNAAEKRSPTLIKNEEITSQMDKLIEPKKKEIEVTDEEANKYVDKIKKYEGTGGIVIVDGKKYLKNYRLGNEKHITSGYGFYDKNNKEGGMVSEEQARKDLSRNIKLKLKEVKKNIKNFNSLSTNLKENIVASWYRGSLSGSPKTIRLINEGKYKEASIEFLKNDEYKKATKVKMSGVKKRMKDVSEALFKEGDK